MNECFAAPNERGWFGMTTDRFPFQAWSAVCHFGFVCACQLGRLIARKEKGQKLMAPLRLVYIPRRDNRD